MTPTREQIAERELVECQQECGRLIGQLREARAQAYEEIAEHLEKHDCICPLCGEEPWNFSHICKVGIVSVSGFIYEWLRSESRRIRESK